MLGACNACQRSHAGYSTGGGRIVLGVEHYGRCLGLFSWISATRPFFAVSEGAVGCGSSRQYNRPAVPLVLGQARVLSVGSLLAQVVCLMGVRTTSEPLGRGHVLS